ncbi:MAG: ABC transporter substrate-binding protein [Bacteriovoracaceae bacterium]|nr:ABC transporter substrate-binding protein [Bacteriovoracaceae bacterium]
MRSISLDAKMFLFGSFLTSLGSTTYIISLLAFSSEIGLPLWAIGVTIGLLRITGFVVNNFLGHAADKIDPIKLLVSCELIAGILSLFLALSSNLFSENIFFPFFFATTLKSLFTALQVANSAKIAKFLDDKNKKDGSFALLKNKADFGTIIFGTFISLLFIKYFSLNTAIYFDFITFLANGFIILIFFNGKNKKIFTTSSNYSKKIIIQNNFSKYYKLLPTIAISDFILALVMFGANTLNTRLFLENPNFLPFASGAFGLAVWIAPMIDKKKIISEKLIWYTLSIALLLQGLLQQYSGAVLTMSLVRNISYWILFNRISKNFMRDCPTENYASISASRQSNIVLTGSLGEFWVGATGMIDIIIEMSWRATIAAGYAFKKSSNKIVSLGIFALAVMTGDPNMTEAQTLNLFTTSENITRDPHKLESVNSVFFNLQLHRGLFRLTPDLQVMPELTESFEIKDSGKKYLLHLKQAFFTDGSKLDAQDVVNSFYRMFQVGSSMAVDLSYITGSKQAYLSGSSDDHKKNFGVRKISPTIVEFNLDRPHPLFLLHLAVVDSSIFKLTTDGKFLGLGPYELLEETNSHYRLTLRHNFFSNLSKIAPTNIIIKKVKANNEELSDLALKGEIDCLDAVSVSIEKTKRLKIKKWSPYVAASTRILFLSLNPTIKENVRKIIQHTILSEFNFSMPGSNYVKSYGILPPSIGGSLIKSDIEPILHEKIPQLKSKINLRLLVLKGFEDMLLIANQVQSILAKKNIELIVEEISEEQYFSSLKNKNFDLLMRSKFLDYPEALSFLSYLRSGNEFNKYDIQSKLIDNYLDKTSTIIDQQERFSIYKKIQIEALASRTIAPLVFGSNSSGLWSEKVKFVPAHPMGLHTLPLETLELKD